MTIVMNGIKSEELIMINTTMLNELCKNFDNAEIRRKIIEQYQDIDTSLTGNNENGETVELYIGTEKNVDGTINDNALIVKTYQTNGWVRVNYYNGNGEPSGETFEGRWN